MAPGTEGGVTRLLPEGKTMSIFDAAQEYAKRKIPLIAIAGKEYGTGSSRDWAAKGPMLLGIKAVIAESFERIHRSNLIGMGILPLVFTDGQTPASLGLTGEETFSIEGLNSLKPGQLIKVRVSSLRSPVSGLEFSVKCRIDTPVELDYFKHGGILQFVLRQLIK
jgi:aconitate hydratase